MPSGSNADVLYGRKPVQLFLERSPRRAVRIWIDRRLDPKVVDKFSRLARGRSIQISLVDPGQVERLARGAVHQGIALEAEPLRVRSVQDLIGGLSGRQAQSAVTLLVLDGVTDPQNFGAICRTAEAFGTGGVIFEIKNSPPLSGAAYKASAGAMDYVSLYAVPNLTETVRAIKSKNVRVIGLDARSKESLGRISGEPRLALVLGSEGKGIRPQIKSQCNVLCSIPMKGRVGSLNVSAAAAAVCFWRSAQETPEVIPSPREV